MNAGLDATAPIHYYDSDYPWAENALYPENFDSVTAFQGLAHDVTRYRAIARQAPGQILELCCGTGRVALPLARDGHTITAVDISEGMLERFRDNLTREDAATRARVTLVEADVTRLALDRADYGLAIIAFNSLLCIPWFEAQLAALEAVSRHLAPGGLLVIDAVNPLVLKLAGDPVPKPFFTRRELTGGNTYTRFAMVDAIDADQRQRLHGWYDEIDALGVVRRQHYHMHWRPIFRYELALMLANAGFTIEALEGGHQGEPFDAASPRMLVSARKNSDS